MASGELRDSPRARLPLLVWVLPDAALALALSALFVLPLAGLFYALAFVGGEPPPLASPLRSPLLFFGVVAAQNLAFGAVTLMRVLAFEKLTPAWLGLVAPRPLRLVALGLAAGAGFLLVNVALSLLFAAFGVSQNQAAQYPLYAGDPLGQLLVALGGTLLAPIGEELFFRGYAYGALRLRLGAAAAAAASAALFALAHTLSASEGLAALLVPIFLLGLLLALLRERTGSLLPCVVAHILNNSVGMALLITCTNMPGAAVCRL